MLRYLGTFARCASEVLAWKAQGHFAAPGSDIVWQVNDRPEHDPYSFCLEAYVEVPAADGQARTQEGPQAGETEGGES